jgi:hypothetical protein
MVGSPDKELAMIFHPLRGAGLALALGLAVSGTTAAPAEAPPAPRTLITKADIAAYKALMSRPVIIMSVQAENERRDGISQAEIDALDKQWRAETTSKDQPLMAATLTSPASSYLMELQARSIGLYAALFVTDRHGLNVGQSIATSDYWQGDEAKFTKTALVGPDALFIDEPEYLPDLGIWAVQVNFPLVENDQVIGAATVEINLTELSRRAGFASNE